MEDYQEINENTQEDFYEHKPQEQNADLFRIRTSPDRILEEFELQLRNKRKRLNKNNEIIIEQIPETKPLCNEQGIQGIMSVLRTIVNNQTVQANFPTSTDLYRERLLIGNNVIKAFWGNRKRWSLSIDDCGTVVDSTNNLINLFLTRGLNNQERVLYGETFKENTTRNLDNKQNKKNVLADFLGAFRPGAR